MDRWAPGAVPTVTLAEPRLTEFGSALLDDGDGVDVSSPAHTDSDVPLCRSATPHPAVPLYSCSESTCQSINQSIRKL